MNSLDKIMAKKSMFALIGALLICALILPVVPLSPALAQDGTDWTQFHDDAANLGYTSSAVPDSNAILWFTRDIGAATSSSVAIANEHIFVYCTNSLKCLNEASGAEIWSHSIEASAWGSWSSPAYHDSKVFIASEDKVYCLNEADGSEVWDSPFSIPDGGICLNGSVTVADGKVFFGDWTNGKYYCLGEATGAEVWSFQVDPITHGNASSTPAVADGKVYFGFSPDYGQTSPNAVYCINEETGVEMWHSEDLDYGVCSSVAVAGDTADTDDTDGTAYATTYNFGGDASIYAFDVVDGSTKWRQDIMRTDSTPAVAGGKVYVTGGCPGYSNIITYCFNTADGSPVWSTDAADAIGGWTCSPAVNDSKVVVGCLKDAWSGAGNYGTYVLNATTGATLWSSNYGGSSPAIVNGAVFTIANGRVYAFEAGGAGLPDLAPTGIEFPDYTSSGTGNAINAVVKNQGTGAAANIVVTLRANGELIDTQTIASLDAGAEGTVNFTGWTPATAGNYTLKVTTDPGNTVPESNEENNELTQTAMRTDLSAGWNFISTPKKLKGGYRTVGQVFGSVDTGGHSIWLYDASVSPPWGTGMATGDDVEPLDGIWIYSSGTDKVYLAFDTNPRTIPPTKELAAGWNAIGFSDTTETSANSALMSVEAQWAYIIGFDAANQQYEASIINNDQTEGAHDEGGNMYPSKGYWIYMTASKELAGISG